MRPRIGRDYADGCMPIRLRVQAVQHVNATEEGRLLRLLLLWIGALSPNSAGANGPKRRRGALSGRFILNVCADEEASHDTLEAHACALAVMFARRPSPAGEVFVPSNRGFVLLQPFSTYSAAPRRVAPADPYRSKFGIVTLPRHAAERRMNWLLHQGSAP